MATVFGSIKAITSLVEPSQGGNRAEAIVTFTMPAYVASSDNGQLGGGGAALFGLASSATLVQVLQAFRRDGKTITLRASGGASGEAGQQGATKFYAGTWAVATNNLTFNVENQAGTEIDAASGVLDIPITARIIYDLS